MARRRGSAAAVYWRGMIERQAASGLSIWRFCDRAGGTTAARLYTIVQSAKRHNLALSPYLNDVLRRLPLLSDVGASLECLLPDRWAKEHPESVLAERQEESRQAHQRRDHRRAIRRAAVAGR